MDYILCKMQILRKICSNNNEKDDVCMRMLKLCLNDAFKD